MSRSNCKRWLWLFSLILVIVGIFMGAAWPIDAKRNIDLNHSITVRDHYSLQANFSEKSLVVSATKRLHWLGLGVLFVLTSRVFRRRSMAKSFAVTVAVAVLIELFQGFFATRSGQLQDVVAVFVAIPMAYPFSQFLRSPRDV